jgi:chromosome segregation ATPase
VADALDSVLRERLRAVLDGGSATEADLRKLADDGRACELIMRAQLERSERRLAELAADPASALTEIASALRDVNELRPHLNELHASLAELQERAREFRAAWLGVPY